MVIDDMHVKPPVLQIDRRKTVGKRQCLQKPSHLQLRPAPPFTVYTQ